MPTSLSAAVIFFIVIIAFIIAARFRYADTILSPLLRILFHADYYASARLRLIRYVLRHMPPLILRCFFHYVAFDYFATYADFFADTPFSLCFSSAFAFDKRGMSPTFVTFFFATRRSCRRFIVLRFDATVMLPMLIASIMPSMFIVTILPFTFRRVTFFVCEMPAHAYAALSYCSFVT